MAIDIPVAGHWSWSGAYEATMARAALEHWSDDDMSAALLQASLMSYRSAADAVNTVTWPWNGERFRYMNSAPEEYMHNCPWNDWVPPSVSIALFHAAAARNAAAGSTPVQSRVRVLLAPHRDIGGSIPEVDGLIRRRHRAYRDRLWYNLENGVAPGTSSNNAMPIPYIVFAAIEAGSTGARCLRFRRGGDIISTMTLDTLNFEHVGERVIGLSPQGLATHQVYVHFDSAARMAKFSALLTPMLTPTM